MLSKGAFGEYTKTFAAPYYVGLNSDSSVICNIWFHDSYSPKRGGKLEFLRYSRLGRDRETINNGSDMIALDYLRLIYYLFNLIVTQQELKWFIKSHFCAVIVVMDSSFYEPEASRVELETGAKPIHEQSSSTIVELLKGYIGLIRNMYCDYRDLS